MPEALPQNYKQWITVAITAFTSIVGSWFLFKSDSVTSRDSAQAKVIESLLADNTGKSKVISTYLEQLNIQSGIIAEQQRELNALKNRVALLEETHGHEDASELLAAVMNKLPFPSWVHEVENQNWFINDAYSVEYNVHRKDFWSPVNIVAKYPNQQVAQFVENDMRVVRSGVPQVITETYPKKVMNPESPSNPIQSWEVLKAPMVISGRSYIWGGAWASPSNSEILEVYR